MHQRKYSLELISQVGFSVVKPIATSIDTNAKIMSKQYDERVKGIEGTKETEDDPLTDSFTYQSLIGKLLYLTVTKPDIAYGVQSLSQFLQSPRKSHMEAPMRIVNYIKN